jgi:hypothetical protein
MAGRAARSDGQVAFGLIRPALTALAAGNTCILKLSEQQGVTSTLGAGSLTGRYESSPELIKRGAVQSGSSFLLAFSTIHGCGNI